jgi:hypothetical protein
MRYEVRRLADVEEVWARQAAGEAAARVVLVP